MTQRSLYGVHPSVAYSQAILDNLAERTGRSLGSWLRLIREAGPSGGGKELRSWLKQEHRLGGTTAALIAARAEGKDAASTDPDAYLKAAEGYVEAMYSGAKAVLRPLYDRLLDLGRSLGDDVHACPCKTLVPLYRQHVFAQIQPTTRTRIDLGLALRGVDRELPQRLIDTGGLAKGDRITHRIPIAAPEEVDAEVRQWLTVAYELDG